MYVNNGTKRGDLDINKYRRHPYMIFVFGIKIARRLFPGESREQTIRRIVRHFHKPWRDR
jgi:hypothetical protein